MLACLEKALYLCNQQSNQRRRDTVMPYPFKGLNKLIASEFLPAKVGHIY